MRHTRIIGILLGAIAVGAVAVASGLAQQADPVKIGVIQPLSGPVAASGNYVRMGTEIARDWINALGGVLAVSYTHLTLPTTPYV